MDEGQGALTQLEAHQAQNRLPEIARLPSGRALRETLRVTRGERRKSLAVLEAEGAVWRHVDRPVAAAAGSAVLLALFDHLKAVHRAVAWGRDDDR